MRSADVRQDADGRFDDVLQSTHLARLRDACLKDGQFGILIHLPDRQRHSDLGIVAARRTDNAALVAQQLVQPFFHHCLPVAARNAYDRNAELAAMLFGQPLEGFQRGRHHQIVQRDIPLSTALPFMLHSQFFLAEVFLAHHKIAHSACNEFRNVVGSRIAFGRQGKKQGFFREAQRAAVCKQPVYRGRCRSHASGTNQFCYLFNRIRHVVLSFSKSKYGYFSLSRSILNIICTKKVLCPSESGWKGLCSSILWI